MHFSRSFFKMSALQQKRDKQGIIILLNLIFVIYLLSEGDHVSAAEHLVQDGYSIQTKIDQASPDDVIRISKGTYDENLSISKPLTLIGEDGAIIDGNGKGNVITIKNANNVIISGLIIRKSGKNHKDSGIYLENSTSNQIENNQFDDNHFGIYIDRGTDHHIVNNEINGRNAHYAERGNGIHLFKGGNHLIEQNMINHVQDGIYFDFTTKIHVKNNQISQSRYGIHYMFSDKIVAEENEIFNNITGFMVMDSEDLQFYHNKITDHGHFRGFGMLIYHANDIYIEGNEMIRNSTGMSFDKAIRTETVKNIVAANQIGLEFLGKNEHNIFTENNFIANIVQTKITNEQMRLDNGVIGNYWDDYGQFDVTGDGIGEEHYKAGSLYDKLLKSQPTWQFFFESPTVKMWSKAESLFPTIGVNDVYDELPAVEPFPLSNKVAKEREQPLFIIVLGIFFMAVSFFTLVKGRGYR